VRVHLAAEGFQVEGFGGHSSTILDEPAAGTEVRSQGSALF
jgi:hypothetical protein